MDVYGKMNGVRGSLAALQSLFTFQKSTSIFNLQSNELFLKFPRQQMAISKFLSDEFQENPRCGGGYPPSNHSES